MIVNSIMLSAYRSNEGVFALLIDPDKHTENSLRQVVSDAEICNVDILLVGGSLMRKSLENAVITIKKSSKKPVALFPGNAFQFCSHADAILLLSLISGRNPEFLIGNHVIAAHSIKESGMEVIPTGYILIDSGTTTSVQYMSNTQPIPPEKVDIVVATAIAGQQLGHKVIYLEGGSGACSPVPVNLIAEVRQSVDIPIIVGGGLRLPEQVKAARDAGATMVVVGNALERNSRLLSELVRASK